MKLRSIFVALECMPRVPSAVDRNNFVNCAFHYSEGIDGAVENCRESVIGKCDIIAVDAFMDVHCCQQLFAASVASTVLSRVCVLRENVSFVRREHICAFARHSTWKTLATISREYLALRVTLSRRASIYY